MKAESWSWCWVGDKLFLRCVSYYIILLYSLYRPPGKLMWTCRHDLTWRCCAQAEPGSPQEDVWGHEKARKPQAFGHGVLGRDGPSSWGPNKAAWLRPNPYVVEKKEAAPPSLPGTQGKYRIHRLYIGNRWKSVGFCWSLDWRISTSIS